MVEGGVSEKVEKSFSTKILLIGVLPALIAALLVIATLFVSGVIPGNGREFDEDGFREQRFKDHPLP